MEMEKYRKLFDIFQNAGHSLYFVGGCVRDMMIGESPKDIDFATSATPDQQIEIYNQNNIHWEPTGIDHGTITAKYNGEYVEITTFRIDKETDGRHAVVEFTYNIIEDLARRDLTINAMAMDVDGKIIDPFGGADDLKNGIIKFVGHPFRRIEEDYLRILRFFRFYGRFGKSPDAVSLNAIFHLAEGLDTISVERIWNEMARILANTKCGFETIRLMRKHNVFKALNVSIHEDAYEDASSFTCDPSMILGFMLPNSIHNVTTKWKLSKTETYRAQFAAMATKGYDRVKAEADVLRGVPKNMVVSALDYHGLHEAGFFIQGWIVPIFPITGDDLISSGILEGPEIGKTLKFLHQKWVDSRYKLTKDDLLAEIKN